MEKNWQESIVCTPSPHQCTAPWTDCSDQPWSHNAKPHPQPIKTDDVCLIA